MSYNYDINNKFNSNITFKSAGQRVSRLSEELTSNLTKKQKVLAKIIDLKEGDSGAVPYKVCSGYDYKLDSKSYFIKRSC